MKKNKHSFLEILCSILIIFLPLLLFILCFKDFFTLSFSDPLIGKTTNYLKFQMPDLNKVFISPAFWITIVCSFIFVYILFYADKKFNQKIENIKNTYPEVKGVIVDILIYEDLSQKEHKHKFFPIVESFDDNKFYLFFDGYGIKNYTSSLSHFLLSNLTYNLYSSKNKPIEVGNFVKFYIIQEISKLKNINGSIEINNKIYKYRGKLSDNNSLQFRSGISLFNEKQDNFLDNVDNMVLFDGLIDFDAEN